MGSYGEWRVTVYGVTFGELRFLDSHTTFSELYRKPSLGELAVKSLRFGELVVSTFPKSIEVFSVK